MTLGQNHGCAAGRVALLGSILALMAGQAPAQPTQEQINAVRSSCRSDYMSYCRSVTPGGAEALQCLRSNSGKLSAACQRAVDAIAARPAPAAPPPGAAPKQAPPPAPVAAPSAPPPETPAAAVETAAPPPAEAPPAAEPARPAPKAAAKPVPEKAAPKAKAVPAAPPVAVAPPPPSEPAVTAPMPPLPLPVRVRILRICDIEQRTLCASVPPGGNRIVDCLAANEPSLSPACRGAIAEARQF